VRKKGAEAPELILRSLRGAEAPLFHVALAVPSTSAASVLWQRPD
jgi:hypothetical protein